MNQGHNDIIINTETVWTKNTEVIYTKALDKNLDQQHWFLLVCKTQIIVLNKNLREVKVFDNTNEFNDLVTWNEQGMIVYTSSGRLNVYEFPEIGDVILPKAVYGNKDEQDDQTGIDHNNFYQLKPELSGEVSWVYLFQNLLIITFWENEKCIFFCF